MSKLKVVREQLNNELVAFVNKGHGVIYGAPGAGKSYAISTLAESLISKGIPAIVISVEQFVSGSSQEIFDFLKTNLGDVETVNKIPSEAGSERGIIFLDGYDAARDAVVEANLQKALRDVQSKFDNWNLIITIREYDLDKNLTLQRLLALIKTGKTKNAFKIDEFSEEELAEGLTSAGFDANIILSGNPTGLKRLLKNPFNLWLFCRIFDPKDKAIYLSLHTESQLLKAYFDRVVGSDLGVNTIVAGVTQSMVNSGTLNVELRAVSALGSKTEIDRLFSSEVFVYSASGASRVHFKHNILFDYFVSVYCFDSNPMNFIGYLIADKRRSLFLQQSLKFFFFKLWENDRTAYWSLVSLMYNHKEPAISLISKTIPFIPIINGLTDIAEIDFAIKGAEAFRNYFAKYLMFGFQVYPDVNSSIRPRVYETLAAVLNESFVWNLCVQVSSEMDKAKDEIGRKTLSSALILAHKYIASKEFSFSRPLIANWILPGFIKTLDIDQQYKETFIKSIVQSIGSTNYDVQPLYRLCSHIEQIVDFYPALAAEIYVAIFSYKEESQDPVGMGTPILPLQSNKRQDYEMCFYQLDEAFSHFLEVEPKEALKAGIKAGEKEIHRSHIRGRTDEKTIRIDYRGKSYEIVPDFSCIWGDGHRLGEYGLQIIDKAIGYIGTMVEQGKLDLTNELFDLAVANAHVAFSWNLLLDLASQYPSSFAPKIAFLLHSSEVLRATDLDYVIGNNIGALYSHLVQADRVGIERAIMAIDMDTASEEIRKYHSQAKDKYILALPKDLISDQGLKDRRDVLDESDVKSYFVKHFQMESGWTKRDHDDYLKEAGVNMDAQETKSNLSLIDKFEKLEFSKEQMTAEQSKQFQSIIEELLKNVCQIKNSDLQSDIIRRTLDKVDKHFFEIPENQTTTFKLVHELLKLAAKHPEPAFDPKYHSDFDSPGWSPAPRTEAAEIVCKLGLRYKHNDINEIIKTLLSDKVPAVRYLLSAELFRVYFFDESFFWEMLNERAVTEDKRTIKDALVLSLSRVFLKNVSKSELVLKQLFDISHSDHFSENLGNSIVELAIGSIGTFGTEELKKVIKDPQKYPTILRHVTLRLTSNLVYASFAEDKPGFHKSLEYSQQLLSSCRQVLSAPGRKLENLRDVYSVVTEFITRLYFNSELKGVKDLDAEVAEGYFQSISKLIDSIVETAVATKYLDAGATHYFVQMMGNIVEYLPRSVIFWTHKLVTVSKTGDYHIDSMAVKEVVELVETLLSMHKNELSKNADELESVIHLLDIFAEVGWPEALKATWKLDSVFR
ncbi:MAG: ATP-binding protein [Bdellovibrionales bacterium]|nr:ATP-binding protein [Bdellovibrionales bacterium]